MPAKTRLTRAQYDTGLDAICDKYDHLPSTRAMAARQNEELETYKAGVVILETTAAPAARPPARAASVTPAKGAKASRADREGRPGVAGRRPGAAHDGHGSSGRQPCAEAGRAAAARDVHGRAGRCGRASRAFSACHGWNALRSATLAACAIRARQTGPKPAATLASAVSLRPQRRQ